MGYDAVHVIQNTLQHVIQVQGAVQGSGRIGQGLGKGALLSFSLLRPLTLADVTPDCQMHTGHDVGHRTMLYLNGTTILA
jgi:hypothetical protein